MDRARTPPVRPPSSPPLALVVDLCRALALAQVHYCHWKSNEAIDLSANGENDLDLLVERTDADRFGEVLHRLGFKPARPEVAREVPGLIDHYGLDVPSGRLVHLQAHYQLVLGDDMTKNFRLPVEAEYLASSRQEEGLFPLPDPGFELALFVVRMVLKHASWDAQLSLQGGMSDSERRELAQLSGQVPSSDRVAMLADHLPFLTRSLAEGCLGAMQPGTPRRARAAVARAVEHRLAPHARRARPLDVALRTGRRGGRLSAHLVGHRARKRLVAGGCLIGVVGADRSTTSSVSDGLVEWLGSAFSARRFDFDGAGGTESSRRTYARARRYATNGDIAVCHQIPAPNTTGRGEDQDITRPDVLLTVAARGEGAGPSDTGCVLDASRSPEDVLAEARGHVWSHL